MEEKKTLRLPTAVRRILWIALALVLVAAAVFVAWYVVNYRNYNEYRSLILQGYSCPFRSEPGKPEKPVRSELSGSVCKGRDCLEFLRKSHRQRTGGIHADS